MTNDLTIMWSLTRAWILLRSPDRVMLSRSLHGATRRLNAATSNGTLKTPASVDYSLILDLTWLLLSVYDCTKSRRSTKRNKARSTRLVRKEGINDLSIEHTGQVSNGLLRASRGVSTTLRRTSLFDDRSQRLPIDYAWKRRFQLKKLSHLGTDLNKHLWTASCPSTYKLFFFPFTFATEKLSETFAQSCAYQNRQRT